MPTVPSDGPYPYMAPLRCTQARITASGKEASYLLTGICELRRAAGGCDVDTAAAAKHVASNGLVLSLTVLNQEPPEPRDGVRPEALLASAESLKERANALMTAGYTGAAMRKYVRATWLMQDGKSEYNPGLPMTEVVGIAKGDPVSDGGSNSEAIVTRAAQDPCSISLSLFPAAAQDALRRPSSDEGRDGPPRLAAPQSRKRGAQAERELRRARRRARGALARSRGGQAHVP